MAKEVPIAEKSLLTPEEAAAYFNIGVNKIRMMTDSPSCPYVLWSGSRRLINKFSIKDEIKLSQMETLITTVKCHSRLLK